MPRLFDPLCRFARVERLVSKIYFRFSHLFHQDPELRDFWWEMAREEEQHACILFACKAVIASFDDEKLDPAISREKVGELESRVLTFLARGTPFLTTEEAFRIALGIESSEIEAIYSKLLQLGGPHIAKTMENLDVPARVQREKLKYALRRFCPSAELLLAAEFL